MATGIRLLGGVLVLPLIARKLPSDHLGLWYVFLSLQSIATLFDLGFSPAVTRAAGYLWAGADGLKKFGVARAEFKKTAASEPNYDLLNRLIATMRVYYRALGLASGLIILVAGGAWVWIKTQGFPDATSFRLAYGAFAFGGFLNVTGDLWPALLSGINGIRAAQKIVLGSSIINFVVTIVGLIAHLDIWALVFATVAAGLFLRWAGRVAFFSIAGQKVHPHERPQFNLLSSLWPTAWRSGLVSVGAFLVVSANTLICSAFLNLRLTASYGLSLSLIAMLTYVSSTFAQIKFPIINQLRAAGEMNQIVEVWIQRIRLSLLCYMIGALFLLLVGNRALELIGSKTMLLPTGQLALALLIFGLEMHHSLYAGLVISENQNPFVAPSLISGGATVVLSLIMTPRFGIWGMLLAQGITQACFNNWWPVYRAIRGLGLSWSDYWRRYVRSPIHI